jgi:hypothetical protein
VLAVERFHGTAHERESKTMGEKADNLTNDVTEVLWEVETAFETFKEVVADAKATLTEILTAE